MLIKVVERTFSHPYVSSTYVVLFLLNSWLKVHTKKAIFVACVLRRKIFDLPCYHFKMSIYKIVFISDGRKKGRRSVWLL